MSSLLDDPTLLRSLVRRAKSSHSTQGRAVDTTLSHQKHLGGDALAPSALSTRRREQQEQLKMQKRINAAWEASAMARSMTAAAATTTTTTAAAAAATQPPEAARVNSARSKASQSSARAVVNEPDPSQEGVGALRVPVLATIAPSFTKAADEGVEVFGGTRVQGPGYTCMIGLVPTVETVQNIDDDYELISSMRPYQYDAKKQSMQAALREASAPPHPDLLRQLEPTLAAVCPTDLLDVDSLPREYLLNTVLAQSARHGYESDDAASGMHAPLREEEEEGVRNGFASSETAKQRGNGATGALSGTYPFVCQGRPGGRAVRHLPGQRSPGLGQYNPRFNVVETRVTGGYIAPNGTAANVARGLLDKTDETATTEGHHGGAEQQSCTSLEAANGTTASGGTLRAANLTGTVYSKTGGHNQHPHQEGEEELGHHAKDDNEAEGPILKPGENVKGSSMFLSKTERVVGVGTAAPDVAYWPYPDARSTTKRVPCRVRYDVPTNTRRRQPPVSDVPSAVYNVTEDISANARNAVDMQSCTSRDAHWYGKKWGSGSAAQKEQQHHVAQSSDFVDVDAALKATRPAVRSAHLPPRDVPGTDDKLRRHREAQRTNTVSVEMNLSYPPPLISGPRGLSRVRDFAHMPGRVQREHVGAAPARDRATPHLDGPYDDGTRTLDDALAFTERRQRSTQIDPRAPGHGAIYSTTTPTELGEIPNMKLVKPNNERASTFGSGSPHRGLPGVFHDLSYDTERGYRAIEPRVTGDPAIGSVMTRQRREKIFATHGCGPQKILAYDNIDLPQKVKSVPEFEKQITKETQFVGHKIPSERWERKNPKAPGPGHYSVSYNLVE